MLSVESILQLLNKSGILCESIEQLDGLQIPREALLDITKYEAVKDLIVELKQHFSSSYMTSLQSSAEDSQKWPLLNLIRQVMKVMNYRLLPKRISDGYTKDGKKKFRRIFLVQKYNTSSIE
tara:strand:+ start:1644 stop:2009 length:366 start_codon:yes stop_codon:yes gene_type:complete